MVMRKERHIIIKEIPLSERPYEKLELYGEKVLSNSELLAIILGSGTKNESVVALSQKILNLNHELDKTGLRFLQDISLEELKKIKGIGRVKAIRIKALGEFTKRMGRPTNSEIIIKTPEDVAKLLMSELRYERKECVKLIILNSKNKIIKILTLSIGSTSYAVIEPKDILSEPLKLNAEKIILVHNHPSGNPTPSIEDINMTRRLNECAKLMNIELLDHIIIGDGVYQSVKFR